MVLFQSIVFTVLLCGVEGRVLKGKGSGKKWWMLAIRISHRALDKPLDEMLLVQAFVDCNYGQVNEIDTVKPWGLVPGHLIRSRLTFELFLPHFEAARQGLSYSTF